MTSPRLLVLGAGTAGAENFIRSLQHARPSLTIAGGHDDRFVLKRSDAKTRHVVPRPGHPTFVPALRRLVEEARIDLIVPTSDRHVTALSGARAVFGRRIFLPAPGVVTLCRDKYRLIGVLRRHGIPAPATYAIGYGIARIFARLGHPNRVWCRPRTGTCARGGGAVSTPAEARRWIKVWETMQGVSASEFTLAEYLPGREILCQSVWRRGRMVLASTFERLAYFGTDNIPSGVTSLSSLAKTVIEPDVVGLCRSAIAAVAPKASGSFSVDVKEDADGRPHVTEINAGRFFMAMTAFDRVLKHSMALTFVRVALGEDVDIGDPYDASNDYYMVRDIDSEPGIFTADDFFDGVNDVVT